MGVLNVFEKRLRTRNYSERTIKVYSHYVKQFLIDVKTKDAYTILQKIQLPI
jgi:hypothetical protein